MLTTRDGDSDLVIASQTQALEPASETSNGRQCGSEFLAARSKQCTRHYCLGPPDVLYVEGSSRERFLRLEKLSESSVSPCDKEGQHLSDVGPQRP